MNKWIVIIIVVLICILPTVGLREFLGCRPIWQGYSCELFRPNAGWRPDCADTSNTEMQQFMCGVDDGHGGEHE